MADLVAILTSRYSLALDILPMTSAREMRTEWRPSEGEKVLWIMIEVRRNAELKVRSLC